MGKLSEEQIVKNEELVNKLVKQLAPGRSGPVASMLEELPEFFLAPASSRTDFHCCFVGGLTDHSLRVAKNIKLLGETLAPGKFDPKDLIFLGLMHDLGKVGDIGNPLYIPNPSDWHRNKGMLFETNKNLPYMPVCDRSMYLLQKFSIMLTAEEYIAIRISDGPYEKCNEKYAMKETDLAVLLHMADRWSASQEKDM